jgi:hypothetical protein
VIYLIVYVPQAYVEQVKSALFAAGAGRMGNYDSCCWQVEGKGQFRPLQGSQAFLGEVGKLEQVLEVKLELFCQKDVLPQVIQALKASHPYETPAYFALEALHV